MKNAIRLLVPGAICAGLLAGGGVARAADEVHPRLPRDVEMSQGAERGRHIIVMVRVGHGDDLPFILDTGASLTVFDESLEPQLGKRIRTATIWRWGEQKESGVYAAPHFYLGGTRLATGPNVSTSDFKKNSADIGHPIMGLIGMDVLEHYCIQLDFAAGKVRFLDGDHANKAKWGRALPLTNLGDGCLAVRENLAGTKDVGSLIDTGDNGDGWLVPDIYQQWTNQMRLPAEGAVSAPQAVLGGEKYKRVELRVLDAKMLASGDLHMSVNGIGLHALSRYVVTFDFPNRTMYLRKPSAWSVIF
ncbi:MAG: retropepsin-like aspartic protease [Verrucomicrobiae bacterium]|nr:retropepsin-like aspartic protease [Verrucomicrobiae bacterium]